jgi:hypothetical protein
MLLDASADYSLCNTHLFQTTGNGLYKTDIPWIFRTEILLKVALITITLTLTNI